MTRAARHTILTMLFLVLSISIVVAADQTADRVRDQFTATARECLLASDKAWSGAEEFAWSELCLGSDIDMDDFEKAGKAHDLAHTANDKNRYLSEDFLNAILHRPYYIERHKITRLHISHAHLQAFRLGDFELNEVIISDCVIDGVVSITDSEVKHRVLISDSLGKSRALFGGIASEQLDVTGSDFLQLTISSSNIENIDVRGVKLKQLSLSNDNVLHQVVVSDCDCRVIYMSKVSGNRGSISAKAMNWLAFDNDFFSERLDIQVHEWSVLGFDADSDKDTNEPSEALFNRLSTPRLKVDFPNDPDNVAMVEPNVQTMDLGDNPTDFLHQLDSGSAGYAPIIYAAAIKFYGDAGRTDLARQVQIRQKRDERDKATGFNRIVLEVSWAVIGSGLIVERGFAWIGGFAVVGYIVFRTGASKVKGDTQPESWIYYTIDAVIPVIFLNKHHEDIMFNGWRQHYLYFMKILGAALVFLVVAYLKQLFVGTL